MLHCTARCLLTCWIGPPSHACMHARTYPPCPAAAQDYYKAVTAEMMDGTTDFSNERPRRQHEEGPTYDPATGLPYPRAAGAVGDAAATSGTTLLKLRGLPFSVNEDDIVKWFDDPALGIPQLDPKK